MRARGRPPTITGPRRYPNRLRELRQQCRLSQQSVATVAGISIAYYGALERGDKRINVDTAERLCRPLRCSVGDLLAGAHGISVPLTLAVAAADSGARPADYDLPEPQERLRLRRLDVTDDCFAAEIFDDSADCDFARGAILVARQVGQQGPPLHAGNRVLVRFYLDPAGNEERPTHEILYGILDQNVVGDLVLITRTRNRMIPRHAVIQLSPSSPGERTNVGASRDALISYSPRPDDPAEILGVVVYSMAPV